MKKDLEEGKPACIKCKREMKPVQIKLGTINARAWKCSKCGEEILHPLDAEKALKAVKKLTVKGITEDEIVKMVKGWRKREH